MSKATFLGACVLALGLTVGNFGYQWFRDAPNWFLAGERSWFQACALLFAWVMWR